MPVKKEQAASIGPRRTHQILGAQLCARYMTCHCPPKEQDRRSFSKWIPVALGNKDLSSEEWAAEFVADVNAGNRHCGNHVCRPDVCHKTTKSKDGYCRMQMWHYAKVPANGVDKVVKAHGRELQKRWSVEATAENPLPPPGVSDAGMFRVRRRWTVPASGCAVPDPEGLVR